MSRRTRTTITVARPIPLDGHHVFGTHQVDSDGDIDVDVSGEVSADEGLVEDFTATIVNANRHNEEFALTDAEAAEAEAALLDVACEDFWDRHADAAEHAAECARDDYR